MPRVRLTFGLVAGMAVSNDSTAITPNGMTKKILNSSTAGAMSHVIGEGRAGGIGKIWSATRALPRWSA